MQEKPRNREWVKNAAIIFLVVLLVLTFFSNTIMNRSLPEVATQGVTDGSIVARVRGTGTVIANSNTQVKMEKTRVIRSVLVKVGEQVEAGDVLFTLGEGSSEDIEAAEDKLRQLQTSYNRTAATMPEFSYGADYNRLSHLEDAYREAVIAEEAALRAAQLAAPNSVQLANAKDALEAAEKAKTAAGQAYNVAMSNAKATNTEETLEDLQRRQKGILEELYSNSMPYHIEGFHYGEYVETEKKYEGKNLIATQLYKYDYKDGNGFLSGEDVINRQITFVQHRINELTSPVTGEDTEQNTEPQKFTITWKNDDGSIIDQETLYYGETPEHEEPSKSYPAEGKEYSFERWDPTINNVTGDAVYQAVFSESLKKYTITWLDEDGIEIDSTSYQYGEMPIHDEPSKESDGLNIYTFERWSPSITAVTEDADYQAVYKAEIIQGEDEPEEEQTEFEPEYKEKNEQDNTDGLMFNSPDLSKTGEGKGEEDNFGGNYYDIHDNTIIIGSATSDDGESSGGNENKPEPSPSTSYDELDYRKSQLVMLNSALDDYQNLQSSIDAIWYDSALTEAREAYEAAVREVEKWKTAVEVLTLDSNTQQSEAYKTAKSNREYAEEAYLSAKQSLNDKISSNQNTIAGYNIDLADTWQQIEKAKQKLADLTGGEEAQILARVSGTIQTIDAAPGDTKQKDDIIATIEAPDMGYSLSFSVTNDQANRLRPGDTATVSNFYWGTEIVATLTSIKVDQKNPQTNKLLTFDLSGNVTAGSELTLSVGQKSANYDIIIPSSAVRTDSNGTFVLKVESKSSPLGNRYIARRVPVEVLASDDSNSALSADLSFGDYVITTSSAPIKNGDLVRLANS